ncbi:hypothetical protein [Luteolibacter sp. AS25]|uniref:hypothetical protein n=1 Tax=Luteolibacter sp. AS25 TaxID=3135776 RepID=UPI00398BB6E5
MTQGLKHRLELITFTAIACIGAFYCSSRHFCNCGHLAHGSHKSSEAWIVDGIWLFSLVGVAVLGIRDRFHGARPIGIMGALLVVVIAISKSPLDGLDAFVLFILFSIQAWELVKFILKQRRETKKVATGGTEESV